jgi:hypothetical protein
MTSLRSLGTVFLGASLAGAVACGGGGTGGADTGTTGTGAKSTGTSGTGAKSTGTGGTGTTGTGTGGMGTGGMGTGGTGTSLVCGSTMCTSGQVCLVKSGGAVMEPTCVADPCAPQPLSCSCAATLCGGGAFMCSVSGRTVQCTCPLCP